MTNSNSRRWRHLVAERTMKLPTHSFRIFIDGKFGKLTRVTLLNGGKVEELPNWLAKRIIELLDSGYDNITVEDALLYAAGLLNMVGEITVVVGETK